MGQELEAKFPGEENRFMRLIAEYLKKKLLTECKNVKNICSRMV